MDVPAITPTIPTVPAAASEPGPGRSEYEPAPRGGTELARDFRRPRRSGAGPADRPPHTEMRFDGNLNRVVGRIVNEQTGETIQEFPPEQLRVLFTKMREQPGSLVDGTA